MDKITIGIIGYGFVGKAVAQLKDVLKTYIYDPFNLDHKSLKSKINAYNADVVFINVPTDLSNDRLDIKILESCLKDYKETNETKTSTLVIKSTVPVGTCDYLSNKFDINNIVFNPEFLTQRTAMEDFINQEEVYLAGSKEHTNKVLNAYETFFSYHNNYAQIFQTENYKEIELLKLARNTFYSVKVSYCNNLYNLCEKENIDYNSFRKHFARAKWVGHQHTYVPGPDGKFGYGGKCLPKDSIELLNFLKENDTIFGMLEQSINFNKNQRNKGD